MNNIKNIVYCIIRPIFIGFTTEGNICPYNFIVRITDSNFQDIDKPDVLKKVKEYIYYHVNIKIGFEWIRENRRELYEIVLWNGKENIEIKQYEENKIVIYIDCS